MVKKILLHRPPRPQKRQPLPQHQKLKTPSVSRFTASIAQGDEVLYKHALEGFNGAKGSMPARGGNASLKDDEVKSAVDYMVAQSR